MHCECVLRPVPHDRSVLDHSFTQHSKMRTIHARVMLWSFPGHACRHPVPTNRRKHMRATVFQCAGVSVAQTHTPHRNVHADCGQLRQLQKCTKGRVCSMSTGVYRIAAARARHAGLLEGDIHEVELVCLLLQLGRQQLLVSRVHGRYTHQHNVYLIFQ